jgi:hypothetical protein
MVNNFELIKQHLTFLNERSFYFVQIIKRKKENPELKGYSRPVESFYIFNLDQFDRMMPHIIELCEKNRARAYIKMNALDANSVGLETISVLTQELRRNNWKHLSKAFNSACGICGKQDGTEKMYLIDLDTKDKTFIDTVKNIINNICEPLDNTDKVKMVVPTKNGYHFISTGFNQNRFREMLRGGGEPIDIHSDGITLLYFPESCDNE